MKKPSRLRVFLDRHPSIHRVVVHFLRWKAGRHPCPFCEIVQGQHLQRVIYQDDRVTAFWDAHPSSATHILLVPNRHIASLDELEAGDDLLCGHLLLISKKLAHQYGLQNEGYHLTINTGLHAGQTVFHLHLHLKNGILKDER